MTKIAGWKLHGESPCRDLVAGLLPASGMHFIVCGDDDTRRAIVADMSVAIAAGTTMASDIVRGTKKGEDHRIVGGFLGLDVCDGVGVAVVGATSQSDVDAASAWRGIKSALPIAISTAPKADIVSARLHDLRHEINIGLVVVLADWSRGVDEVKRVLNYRGDFAVLVVSATEPPETMIQGDSRVIRVADGSLELSHPATSTPWVAPFTLEAISISGGKAYGVRASSEAASTPQFAPGAEEAPQAQEIRTIVFGSDGVSTLDEVVAAVRDSTMPTRIVAPAIEREKIRAALDEAKEVANRRLDLALGYRLRDARDSVASAA